MLVNFRTTFFRNFPKFRNSPFRKSQNHFFGILSGKTVPVPQRRQEFRGWRLMRRGTASAGKRSERFLISHFLEPTHFSGIFSEFSESSPLFRNGSRQIFGTVRPPSTSPGRASFGTARREERRAPSPRRRLPGSFSEPKFFGTHFFGISEKFRNAENWRLWLISRFLALFKSFCLLSRRRTWGYMIRPEPDPVSAVPGSGKKF